MATGFNKLGAAAYTTGPTPKAPLDPGTIAFVKPPPAIVQSAHPARDWHFYETTIIANEQVNAALLKEYKEGETWRDHYKTWEAACVPLGKSRRRIDELILNSKEQYKVIPAVSADSALSTTPEVTETLKTIAKLPVNFEEEEKPHIKTRDEIIEEQTSADVRQVDKRKATDNGKPKYLLPIWKEQEERHGLSLRRTDELNRQCPNPRCHAKAIAADKAYLDALDEWREELK